MNLYLIRRGPNHFEYDTYAYAIVAAETVKAAQHTHPTKGVVWENMMWTKGHRNYGSDMWTDPHNVRTRLLGKASEGTKAGTICTSFY